MKKVYKKPIIYIEKFNVSEDFAYGCSIGTSDATHRSEHDCSIHYVFYGNNCEIDATDADFAVGCYNGAFESGQPFSS